MTIINNCNNYKTSIAPISSERIELSSASSIRDGQTYIPDAVQSSSTHDQMECKKTMLFDDLKCSGNEFQRVGTATEKAWVLTLGTDNKWKPDERSSLIYLFWWLIGKLFCMLTFLEYSSLVWDIVDLIWMYRE